MPRVTRNFRWKAKSRKKCARGSTRTIKRGRMLLHICCPVGKWSERSKKCKVGTFAKEIGFPKK